MTASVEMAQHAPETQAAAARPSLLGVLKIRDFRLVWLGESISLLGDQFYFIALPWLTLQLTDASGLAVGMVATAAGIPRAVFMLVGGAITDRVSPRTVMLVSNAVRLALTALLAVLVVTGYIQLWMLILISLLFGLVDAFFIPAQTAIIPQLVGKEQIESGNALTQITAQLTGFVGPVLAGLVIATLSGASNMEALVESGAAPETRSLGAAFGFDALTFVVATLALWLMRGGGRAVAALEPRSTQGLRASIAEGIRIVWSDPILRTMIFLTTAINFLFTGPIGVGLPVLAGTHFAEGAAALGGILSAFGGGALLGAVLAGSLPTPRRFGVVALVLIGFAGFGLALFGFVERLALGMAVGAGMGIAVGYVNVLMVSWLQKRTDPQVIGRVMSLVMLGSMGLQPVSNAVAGVLVDVNLTLMFVGAGLLLAVISLWASTKREVREIG